MVMMTQKAQTVVMVKNDDTVVQNAIACDDDNYWDEKSELGEYDHAADEVILIFFHCVSFHKHLYILQYSFYILISKRWVKTKSKRKKKTIFHAAAFTMDARLSVDGLEIMVILRYYFCSNISKISFLYFDSSQICNGFSSSLKRSI